MKEFDDSSFASFFEFRTWDEAFDCETRSELPSKFNPIIVDRDTRSFQKPPPLIGFHQPNPRLFTDVRIAEQSIECTMENARLVENTIGSFWMCFVNSMGLSIREVPVVQSIQELASEGGGAGMKVADILRNQNGSTLAMKRRNDAWVDSTGHTLISLFYDITL